MTHPDVQRYRDALRQFLEDGDPRPLLDRLAPDVVWHEAGKSDVLVGREAILRRMRAAPAASRPDVRLRAVLGDDRNLVVVGHAEVVVDDRRCSYDFVEHMAMRDGLVVERWSYMDAMPREVADFFAWSASRESGGRAEPAPDQGVTAAP